MKTVTSSRLGLISHPDFGQVRNVIIKGEVWFVAKDVCDALGHSNSRKAISDNVYVEDRADVTISDGSQNRSMTIINESGLYSLIMKSRLEIAKTFQRWVTSEVLPAIRRQGYYIDPSAQLTRAELRKLSDIMLRCIKSQITPKDIWDCHNKLRVLEDYIQSVINGRVCNNNVMLDLQERAMLNKERYEDAYSPARMQRVNQKLSI